VKELSFQKTKNPFWKGIECGGMQKLGTTNHNQSLSGRAGCDDE